MEGATQKLVDFPVLESSALLLSGWPITRQTQTDDHSS